MPGRHTAPSVVRRTTEEELNHWIGSELGSTVGRGEAVVLQQWLTEIFGYRLVQCGTVAWPEQDPLQASSIGHKVLVRSSFSSAGTFSLVADPAQLPLASESIDLVILPHTLDFSADPRQVLREAERVLIPDGRLITIGFNPWSLWGARRLLAKLLRVRRVPWSANFIGYMRLGDWLNLLGFEVERTEVMMFRPPFSAQSMLRRIATLEEVGRRLWPMLAAVYMVQAIKRTRTLTPIRPQRLRPRRLVHGALEPSTRTTVNG